MNKGVPKSGRPTRAGVEQCSHRWSGIATVTFETGRAGTPLLTDINTVSSWMPPDGYNNGPPSTGAPPPPPPSGGLQNDGPPSFTNIQFEMSFVDSAARPRPEKSEPQIQTR